MSRTHRSSSLLRAICIVASFLPCAFSGALLAQAVTFPQTIAVGSASTPLPVRITAPAGGTIASVEVLGQGSLNTDFAPAGGSCTVGANILPAATCTLSVSFAPASPGERRGAVVLLDSNKRVIGSQLLVGQATGAVGVFVPGIISTVAGDSTWVYDGDGRAATSSAIFLPFGIAVDAAGDLFIADSSNNRVRRVDAKTGIMSTIAGDGVIGDTGDGGLATFATLNDPTSVAIDPAGNVFFADAGNNAIRRVDAFSGIITTVAGTLGRQGYSGDQGPATSAMFNTPNGISFDSNGNLYIADTGNHVIRLLNTSGVISTVAGTGAAGYNGDNQAATRATLSAPWSATPIAGGGFYIADQHNSRIRMVDASGQISTIAGGTPGYAGDGGPASQAELTQPAAVLVDVAGNLYIADSGNNCVRRINASTGIITTFAGNGGESLSGDNGPATLAGIYGPYAFALDAQGNLYMADVFHNRIRRVGANTASLTYPVIRVDRVSSPITQAIENDGNAPMDFTAFSDVTNSQLDAGTTTCSMSSALAPLSQCVVGIDFAPTTTGTTVLGSFNIVSDAGNSPGVVKLQGQVLNVNPTSTSLVSSANPSLTGNTVTFSVQVTSSGTTPTGLLYLLDGTTKIASANLGAGGIASFPISTLTHGSHAMTASYAGDSQNAASVSTVLNQLVQDPSAATTTSLVANSNPSIAGTNASFTATVAVVTANSGIGSIGGTVSLKQGLNVVAVANINAATANAASATASFAITSLPVGTDSLVAVYSGNSGYAGSTSAPLVQTVTQATSSTSLASAKSPSIAGSALTLTAKITSNGAAPTGNVTFMDGATSLGSAPINAQGIAGLSVAGRFWTVGTHTLTAVYPGDSNNTASNSAPLGQQVIIATTSTTAVSSLNPAGLGAAVTFTATVGGNGGSPSGTVQFFDGTSPIGSATLSATSTAAITNPNLAVGSHQITAVYSGDTFDAASTSTAITETIQTATIAIRLASSINPVIFNNALTLSAQVSGSGSTPTGTVSLIDGSATLATLPLPASGVVIFSNPSLAIGTHTLTAAYSGDTNHSSTSSAVLTETVQQATTTAIAPSAFTVVAGTPLTLTSAVTGVSGKPVSGVLNITDGAVNIASLALTAGSASTFTTSSLAPGTHVLIASYAGDTLDAASSSTSIAVKVNIATTSASFATSANPINSGSALTLSCNVSGNGGTPTGTVDFLDGGKVLSSVQLSTAGAASLTLSSLAPGIHQLSARYSGDMLDGSSVSSTIAQEVVQKTTVTLTSNDNPSLLQDSVVLTVNVTNGSTSNIPTGQVAILDGATTLATVILNPSGTASFTWQAPAVGAHSLSASYAGDNQNSPASFSGLTQTVTLRPSTVSNDPSATAISLGQQITMISVVQGQGSAAPTGTVSWTSGSTVLGSATIDSTGLATSSITPPAGTLNLVARYSGDALYAPATSPAVVITVGPPVEYVINVNPGSMSMASGSHGSVAINITTAKTFSDTLALGCAGLPQFATCTFSENQIVVANGVSHNLTVTVDTGTPLGAGPTAKLVTPAGRSSNTYECALPAAALLALLLGVNRRRLRWMNGKLALLALLLAVGASSTILSGCGSSFTQSATAAGSYTIQIVATGDKTGVSQTAAVQLTVGK